MAPARRPGLPVLGARLRMPAALPWRRGPAANWRCFGLNPDAPPRRPGVAKNPAARVTAAWAGGRKVGEGDPEFWGGDGGVLWGPRGTGRARGTQDTGEAVGPCHGEGRGGSRTQAGDKETQQQQK